MSSAITFSHVSKSFGKGDGEFHALDDISFEVPSGSFFGVIGTSGAGKSTLIRTVNGLGTPTSGTVTVLGKEPATLKGASLRELRRSVGMIFQHYNLLQSKTVAQNVAVPLILAHTPKKEIAERVRDVLELVGLESRADSYPSQLSGGQSQRVGIARTLVTNPKILLSDEATSALDPITTVQILDLLHEISVKRGITVLLITHQMTVIAKACDRVVVLSRGKIIEQGSVRTVFAHPQHDLTQQFVETVLPRSLSAELSARIDSGAEGAVVRVTYQDEAAKDIFDRLRTGLNAASVTLLSANERPLREVSIGHLVVGIQGISRASEHADLAARLAPYATDNLSFEVLHE
ncbi:MAG: ATP-binding cassette domain-containing protein [Bifidobacteriaceae bacterium]|jgi:D-methionine transport system ATP-binding protein|nr:ATP-binding cassette domain-containing protein [Bifidobacteriaceae bacterium]MCI1914931.1 ATP-binding cassette domain-containing protein [Bifidobacteriaceae bacterium]